MVEVVVAWRDHVLEVRAIRRHQSASLRSMVGALPISPHLCCDDHTPLIVAGRDGPRLVIPPVVGGSIERTGERPRALDELDQQSLAFRSAPRLAFPPGTVVRLMRGTTVRLDFGDVELEISRSAEFCDAGRRRKPAADRRLSACCAAVAVSAAGVLSASAMVLPPLRGGPELREPFHGRDFVLRAVKDDISAKSSEPAHVPVVPGGRKGGELLVSCRCPEDRTVSQGCREATVGDRRYAVRGPQDNPDPHIARRFEPDRATPPFSRAGAAPAWDPAGDSVTAPWGRDDSLGTDAISVRGNMWGPEIGDTRGERSLGALAPWGGLTKAIIPTDPGASAERQPPRVVHTALGAVGPLGPSAILPVITPRFPMLAGCFVAVLQSTPELGARLDVRFRIETTGLATQITAKHSGAPSQPLESCIRSAFVGLSFPPSEAGPTVVTYPLLRVERFDPAAQSGTTNSNEV